MAHEVEFDGTEQTFEPIPPGNYVGKVNNIEEREGSAGKYLSVRFIIDEGQHKNRNLFTNLSFSKDALWKMKNFLIATDLAKAGEKTKIAFEAATLLQKTINKRVGLKVVEDQYNGEIRAAVGGIYRLREDGSTPPQPETTTTPSVRRL